MEARLSPGPCSQFPTGIWERAPPFHRQVAPRRPEGGQRNALFPLLETAGLAQSGPLPSAAPRTKTQTISAMHSCRIRQMCFVLVALKPQTAAFQRAAEVSRRLCCLRFLREVPPEVPGSSHSKGKENKNLSPQGSIMQSFFF